MGLVIVTPEGKEAKTIFKRLSYDAKRGQSVVHCECLSVSRVGAALPASLRMEPCSFLAVDGSPFV
jgi:hypothetical protein